MENTKKRRCSDSNELKNIDILEQEIYTAFKDLLPKEFKPKHMNLKFKPELKNNVTTEKMGGFEFITALGPIDYKFEYDFELPDILKVIGDGFIRIHRSLDTIKNNQIEYHTILDDPSPCVEVGYIIYPDDDDEEIFDTMKHIMGGSFLSFIINSVFPDGELREVAMETLEPFVEYEPAL